MAALSESTVTSYIEPEAASSFIKLEKRQKNGDDNDEINSDIPNYIISVDQETAKTGGYELIVIVKVDV